jgi:hypothetical protein
MGVKLSSSEVCLSKSSHVTAKRQTPILGMPDGPCERYANREASYELFHASEQGSVWEALTRTSSVFCS